MKCLFVSKFKKWTTTIGITKDDQFEGCKKTINVNEEYQGALRSQSFADFFSKAQLLVHEPSLSTIQSFHNHRVLLEPDQETIATILETDTMSRSSDLKDLILDYFDITYEASKICTKLLKSIFQIRSSYLSIQQIINLVVEDYPPQSNVVIHSNNPFYNVSQHDFEVIHDKYLLTLEKMKVKRRNVAKKMKLIRCFNKAIGVCVTTTCGLVAVAAIVLAMHTLTSLVIGPLLFSIVPLKPLKKKLANLELLKSRFLKKVGDEIDVAMKGTFILNRDFDTMSRLVDRLRNDIERNQKMIELCIEKGRGEDKICLQVLREMEKSDVWFRKQVEELEEHVYLCLMTINKARKLVIKELSKSCNEKLC